MLPYFSIIQKHIDPVSDLYRIYIIHVSNVTRLALKVGKRLKLKKGQLEFIEEASMLHDIGIVKTNTPEIFCYGKEPYIMHLIEGREMLLKEGLPLHARVAANHVGVGGLSKQTIIKKKIPLPKEDFLAETIEEKIISYADLFYSKNPDKVWKKKSPNEIKEKLIKRPENLELFKKWYKEFGE